MMVTYHGSQGNATDLIQEYRHNFLTKYIQAYGEIYQRAKGTV
jgi:cytoplasmic iron level regulating protein YaaA (DUF328/UPF0246 family)